MFAYDLDNFPITLKINKSYPAGTEIDDLSAQFVCSFDDVNAAIESGALNITEVTDENKALDEYQEPKRTNAINLVNYLIANYSDEAEVVSGTGIKASIKVNNEEATTIEHYSVLLLTAEAGEDTAFDGWYYDGKLVSSNASYTVYTDPAILAKLEARFKSA